MRREYTEEARDIMHGKIMGVELTEPGRRRLADYLSEKTLVTDRRRLEKALASISVPR